MSGNRYRNISLVVYRPRSCIVRWSLGTERNPPLQSVDRYPYPGGCLSFKDKSHAEFSWCKTHIAGGYRGLIPLYDSFWRHAARSLRDPHIPTGRNVRLAKTNLKPKYQAGQVKPAVRSHTAVD